MKITAIKVAIILTTPIWVPAFIVGVVAKVLYIGLKLGFDLINE